MKNNTQWIREINWLLEKSISCDEFDFIEQDEQSKKITNWYYCHRENLEKIHPELVKQIKAYLVI